MKPNQEHPRTAIYLLLLAIQIFGAIVFVWQELPEFRQVLTNPGEQLAKDASSDLMTAGILFVLLLALRTFCITGGYHRYFAHRSFKIGRHVRYWRADLILWLTEQTNLAQRGH